MVAGTFVLPASAAQRRIWLLHQRHPDSGLFNLPSSLRLRGRLDLDALQESLRQIVHRHEALRTAFEVQGDELMQVVRPDADARIDVEITVPDQLIDALRAEARRPFDLARGPLIRCRVWKLDDLDHALQINIHHIVADGWSLGVFARELESIYGELSTGREHQLPDVAIQFADVAIWEREQLSGGVWARHLEYWQRSLADAPATLSLPADRPVPERPSDRGRRISRRWPRSLAERVDAFARREQTTMFAVVLAAFQTLLARHTGESDFIVGTPVASRDRVETESVIGCLVNLLPIRGSIDVARSFRSLVRDTASVVLDGLAHEIPFDVIVEHVRPARAGSAQPLVQVLFAHYDGRGSEFRLAGLDVEWLPIWTETSKYDLMLTVEQDASGLQIVADYLTDRFDAHTIERWLDRFTCLVDGALTDPDCAVGDLPLLTNDEREQLIGEWSGARVAAPGGGQMLHDLVRLQAERTPDRIAIEAPNGRMTYAELDERASRWADALRRRGVGRDVLVAVMLERSPDLVAAMLAVLRAGGAFVPLDADHPGTRLAAILEDSRAALVLTQSSLVERLPKSAAPVVMIDAAWPDVEIEHTPAADRDSADPTSLAYVLFTSGSTGRPKGVAIEHRSAVAFIEWACGFFSADEWSAVLWSTSVTFDLSIFEVFGTLSAGGTIILARHALDLPTLPARDRITLINTVPSVMAELVAAGAVPLSVRTVNLAGEPLTIDLARRVYAGTGVQKVYNLYGPTESTTYATVEPIAPGENDVTIGRPIAGTRLYILDTRLQPVPIGVTGELYLAGAGLARGYVGRPDLTAERFIADPFHSRPNDRMYRTGDRCRWRRDGRIEFLGRADEQIKLRGFRIELGEIEAVLGRHDGVRQSVVVLRQDGATPQLVAYVEPAPGAPLSTESIDSWRSHLERHVPGYMVPSAFVVMTTWPHTATGKIDRARLPVPSEPVTTSAKTTIEPRTPTERRLADLWRELLGIECVGVGDDFFALGGHSLLAMRLMFRVQQIFGVTLPAGALFDHRRLEELAARIDINADRARVPLSASSRPQPALFLMEAGPANADAAPFFWLHGVGGEAFSFRPVAEHLAVARPVYGFTADWTQMPIDDPLTLEHMAAHYLGELRGVQPTGPYHLGGFCSGVMLALEMARQLEAAGERVGLLAGVDGDLFENSSAASGLGAVPAFLANAPRWVREDARPSGGWDLVARVRARVRRTRARRRMPEVGAAAGCVIDPRDGLGMWRFPDHLVPMLTLHQQVFRQYVPQPIASGVTLILPRTAPLFGPWPSGHSQRWTTLARGGVTVRTVPGSHSTMLAHPFARAVAEAIDEGIRKIRG